METYLAFFQGTECVGKKAKRAACRSNSAEDPGRVCWADDSSAAVESAIDAKLMDKRNEAVESFLPGLNDLL